jgi:hypothetical protein
VREIITWQNENFFLSLPIIGLGSKSEIIGGKPIHINKVLISDLLLINHDLKHPLCAKILQVTRTYTEGGKGANKSF